MYPKVVRGTRSVVFSVINERWREDRDRTAINLIKNKL